MTLGGPPVTILDAGGLPVTPTTTPGAVPFTVIAAGGMPITLADNAYPMTLLDEDGAPWTDGGGGPHASDLLDGETQGLAIDFTLGSGLGEVAVIDTTTPANNKNDVPVDDFLTQSGTSPKLVLGADGLYHWSPHNLIFPSATLATQWVVELAGTISGTTFRETAVNNFHILFNELSLVTGATYTATIDIQPVGYQWIFFQLGSANSGAWYDIINGVVGTSFGSGSTTIASKSIALVTPGVYRCTIVVANCSGSGAGARVWTALADNDLAPHMGDPAKGFNITRATFNRGAEATTYMATTTAARFGVPIEYGGGGYYALVEPQATNILLWSQALDDATWAKGDATITANAIAAPDGTLTAEKVAENANASPHIAFQAATVTTGTPYTFSAYLKAGERTWAYLRFDNGVAAPTWFDLVNGVVGTSFSTSASITPVGNGWYRCSVTNSPTVTPFYGVVGTATGDNVGAHAGTVGSGIYAWGAQLEAGAVATSPIPTFAATVTRAADDIYGLVTAIPYSSAAGTLTFEYTKLSFVSSVGNPYLGGLSNTAVTSYIAYQTAANAIASSGDANLNVAGVPTADGTANKIAFAFASGDKAVSLNGSISADASFTAKVPDKLTIGNLTVPASFGSHAQFRRVTYLPRRMTNAELQTKTAP